MYNGGQLRPHGADFQQYQREATLGIVNSQYGDILNQPTVDLQELPKVTDQNLEIQAELRQITDDAKAKETKRIWVDRVADRAAAKKLEESDRKALTSAGRPVTTSSASSSLTPTLSGDQFPAIDPKITDREARRMLVGDGQTPTTKDQFKRLKIKRAKLPAIQDAAPAQPTPRDGYWYYLDSDQK